MENRFTIKDFFLFSLLGALMIVLVITMYMIDRQWLKMASMETVITEQAADLRQIRQVVSGLSADLQKQPRANAERAPISRGELDSQADLGAFSRSTEVQKHSDYAEGDWLVRSFGNSIKTITPLVSSDRYASDVQGYVLESLLERNPESLEWEGRLASSWKVSDDGLSYVFTLRPGTQFSDGHPLTAQDVAFTFSFIMNQRIAAPRERAYYDKIATVEAVSDREVKFVFKEPYFDSLALAGGMSVLAEHFYGRFLEDPETFNQSKGLLFGSGPYRLLDPENWRPDQGVVELERNPRYWGPVQPSFDKVIWQIIENETARLTSFRNGDVDVYGAKPREFKKLNDDQVLMSRAQSFEYTSPTAGYSYIGWNQEIEGMPTRFADSRVRRAMTFLTDRQRIVDEIMLGFAEPAVGPFSPLSHQHDPELKPRPYNLERGTALLEEAGYADRDGDGVIEDPEGEPFSFELVYFQDSEDTKRIVLFLKDLYARAGIQMIPKPTEWSVMLDLIKKKNFEAITLGWTGSVEGDLYQIFHSSQRGPGADNFVNYASPELDKLIEQARSSVNGKERMPLWQQAEKIIFSDQPYTFLLRRKSLVFVDGRMKNVEVSNLGLNLGETPISWYVPLGLQKYH